MSIGPEDLTPVDTRADMVSELVNAQREISEWQDRLVSISAELDQARSRIALLENHLKLLGVNI